MQWCGMRKATAIFLLFCCGNVFAEVKPGPWFDRARNGHGIDIQRSGDTYLVNLYTFDQNGEPEWFAAQGALVAGDFTQPLLRFVNDGDSQRPAVRSQTVGSMQLRFGIDAGTPACADGTDRSGAGALAELSLSIGGEQQRWCVEPLLPPAAAAERSMDGTWWGGPADSGWGLTTYFLPQPGALVSANLLYFYDASGAPRWSSAQTVDDDFALATRWVSYRGYCRSCPTQPLVARDGGPLTLSLSTPLPAEGLDNRLSMNAVYAGPAGGSWNRQIRLQRISGLFPAPRSVATREGLLAGTNDIGATIAWRGIPFAAAPLGALRWRAPQPAPSRQRVLAATEFGPGCPQGPAQGFFGGAPPRTDEDCLSLNVWAPEAAAAGTTPLPVMLWIHGGGHVQGGSSQQLGTRPLFDGSVFAQRGVILVSINYRLGPLGYAAFRELIGEHPDQPGAGNYGLLDQIAALRWVRDNIRGFGGDPANVTIFGESAGGVSVCAVLASPLAAGLFHRAIIQSGGCTSTSPRLLASNGSREAAVTQGERIKQRLGCVEVDARGCLRAKTAAELVTAGEGAVAFSGSGETYDEVIDDYALTTGLGDAVRTGTAAQVPLMIGINEDETTSLVPVAQRPQNAAAYESLVRSRLTPLIAEAALLQYPTTAYVPVWRAWTAINTDVAFICPAARVARDHAARGNPVFAYYLTQTLPNQPELGAFHGLDIPLLFSPMSDYGPGIRQLAAGMQSLWVSFAIDGDPAVPGLPTWPRHPSDRQLGLELRADGIGARADYRDAFCNFWARYVRL